MCYSTALRSIHERETVNELMDLGDCAEDWPDDAALGVDELLVIL